MELRDYWRIVLRRLLMDWQFEADGAMWQQNLPTFSLGARDRTDPSYARPLTLPPELAAELAKKA